jgi:hypothetical protein
MKKKNRRTPHQQGGRGKKPNRVLLTLIGLVIVVFILSLVITPGGRTPEPAVSTKPSSIEFVKHGELTFLTPDRQPALTIDVEIADDDASREQGLMYRTAMEERQGMFFVFFDDDLRSFWMKNTVMSLDILFVNANNEIVTIHRNTTPFSEQEYPSGGVVRYVVEVRGGFADRHNIRVGNKIQWRRIPAG